MDILDKTREELQKELTELQREFYYLNEIKDIDTAKRIQLEQELAVALKEIVLQNEEKEKRAAELILANLELKFQSEEKAKRAAELVIANIELVFQNKEKAKRAAELIVANKELAFQNGEKSKRAVELQKSKEKAEESEGKLKEAQRIAHLGNWELNIETNKLFWSDEIYRIFDCEPHEFEATYESFIEFIHPDDREKVNSAYLKSLETKTEYQIEHRLITKKNQIKFVREKCLTTFNEQGKPLNSFGIVIDITEQKELENELIIAKEQAEQSEEKFSKSFFNSPDSIILNRLDDGKIVTVNKGFVKIMGYEEAEVLGKTTSELNFYKNPKERNAIINALKTTGQAVDIECWFITKHGEEKLGLLSAAIIDIDGVKHIISNSRDITDRKKTELLFKEKAEEIEVQNEEYQQLNEELNQTNQELAAAKVKAEQSEEKFSKSFFNSPDSIILNRLDDGKIVTVNKGFVKIMGYEEAEVLGKTTSELNFYKNPKERNAIINALKTTGQAVDIECWFITKHGEEKLGLLSAAIIDIEGVKHIISTSRDITDRKKIELLLQEKTEEIEVQNEEFQQLNEELNQSNQELAAAKEIVEINEARMKMAMEVSKSGAWDWDILKNTFYWSDEFLKLFGLPENTIAGFEAWTKALHPDDIESASSKIKEAIEKRTELLSDYRIILFNSEIRWIRATGHATYLNNKPVRMIGLCMDITDQKTAEQELQKAKERAEESEANLKAALENSQAGIAIAEYPSGKLKYVNKSALLIRDKEYGEIVKDIDVDKYVSSWQILHFDGTPYQTDEVPLARAILYGETSSREFIVRRDTKEDRYVWANAAPIYNVQGIQTSAIVIFLDITERKQAEKELKESEEKYRMAEMDLLEAQQLANIGSWHWDIKTGLVAWSKELYDINGHNPDIPVPVFADMEPYYTTESWKVINEAVARTFNTGEPYNLDIEMVKPDGTVIFTNTRGRANYDEAGEMVNLHGTVQDITERKRLQDVHSFLSSSGYPGSNENFFESLAKYLAKILDSEYVCIDKLEGDGLIAQTVAIYNEGKFDTNVSYTLKQTPCGDVVGKTICCFPENVCQLFPQDEALQDLKAHSYIGTTLWSFDGKPIGLIAIIGQKPLKNTAFAENVLKLVAIRAAGELERMQTEDELKKAKLKAEESEEYFRSIFENSPIGKSITGIDGSLKTNKSFSDMLGYPFEEFQTKNLTDITHPDDIQKTREVIEALLTGKESVIRFEKKHIHKNGSVVYSEVVTTLQKNSDGKPLFFITSVQDITMRKLSEKALKESEERFKNMFERHSSIMLLVDPETGMIINANHASVRFYGYSKPELLSMRIDQINILPPEQVKMEREQALREERSYFIFPHKLANGEVRTVEVHSSPIVFQEQKILFSIIHDITERKLAEAALLKSEHEFRLLAESMPQIVWITRPDGWNIFFNQHWIDYTGLSLNESFGDGWIKPFHPADQQHAWDAWKNATTYLTTYSIECRLRRFDGEYKWWLIRGVPVFDEFGELVKWFGTCTDIDEIKCSEADLLTAKERAEEFENKFRQIAENIDEVFWLRTNSEMIYVSPSFEKIWGVPCEEIYENPQLFTEKVHPEDKPIVQEIFQSNEFKEKEFFNYEYRIIRADNQVRWINTKTFPIVDDSGQIIKRVGIASDITEKYQTVQELVKAKERAEESDRLKSAFLANMSHEIRTPMNGILGFSELLKEPDLTGEKQQEYIRIIEKSGVRMLNTINDIVDISKIEANLMNVDIKDCNINEKIEFIYTFFKPQVEEKGMQLLFKNTLPVKEAIIRTDSEKVYSILTNLVKNAIKYSKGGTIEFGYLKKSENLEFYVKDNGIGIPKDRQSAIFERFVQADITDKMARQGAGLGLSISKAYVEMLGGNIWVESEEGIGSTFYFTLPYNALSEEKKVHEKTVQEQDKENQINPGVSGLKILIVEDDETSEMLIAIDVKKFSKEIIKVKNGFEAVEACRNNPDTDLILMDIQLPEMNGYEASRQIRQFNQDVVIIAQTAFGLAGDREKAIEAGCNDYIAKPINKRELMALILKYFGK